ncbi:MAG: HAD family hydrolase [Rhodobacterales bacterium]|nr:HAD family hydrolase [Rhodobacterales bacterium]
MIAGIIFDKDGTLFDFRASWAGWARAVLAELGRDGDHATALAVAMGFDPGPGQFHPDSPVIAGTSAEVAEALLPHLPGLSARAVALRLDAQAVRARMEPAVPLAPLLGALRGRGLRLGLATNDVEQAARAHLAAAGIADLFDYVAGADSGHGAKPGPGMLLDFAAAHGLDPARVAMVGDSTHDLIAGRAAGMRPVAVLTGIAREPDLAPLAEVVLPDIGALPHWLDRLAAA